MVNDGYWVAASQSISLVMISSPLLASYWFYVMGGLEGFIAF